MGGQENQAVFGKQGNPAVSSTQKGQTIFGKQGNSAVSGSQEGQAVFGKSENPEVSGSRENQAAFGKEETRAISGKPKRPDIDTYECQTCKNRTYQDGSNDPSVSFKTPTRLSPERAAYAVRSHEMEHVAHARMQAEREDMEIVSQSVTYRTGVCPECGRTYIAGGNTRTVFRSSPNTYEAEPIKTGANIDLVA